MNRFGKGAEAEEGKGVRSSGGAMVKETDIAHLSSCF